MSQAPDAPVVPAAAAPRPVLKIRVNSIASKGPGTPSGADPPTSAAEPSSSKIKLKLKKPSVASLPPTPANEAVPALGTPAPPPPPPKPAPVKTKAGRTMKPTAKKRAKDDAISDDETPTAAPRAPTAKRIKLTKTATPAVQKSVKLKVKTKGHPPYHPPGEGYDSELEDREEDPSIEEHFIVRYEGGDEQDLEYLREMVEQGRIGMPHDEKHAKDKDKAPAQWDIKWLPTPCGRRASVRIRNNIYAAILVDLPTITESMKTWDKKNLMKSADICQMLLIFAKVANDQEAKTAPLPITTNDSDFRWPHGLTPPMHDAVQRRFRKRLTKKEVKDKEAELHRLLEADRQASSVRYEVVTIGQDGRESPREEADDEQDAEGEEDDELAGAQAGAGEVAQDNGLFGDGDDGLFDEEIANELENELEDMLDADGEMEETATPLPDAEQPGEANTPAAGQTDQGGQSESGEDDDDDDDDDEMDVDEDAEGEAADKDDANELFAEAERAVAQLQSDLANTQNAILRKRLQDQLKTAQRNLQALKAKQADEEEEED